jgi:hypothetical protein
MSRLVSVCYVRDALDAFIAEHGEPRKGKSKGKGSNKGGGKGGGSGKGSSSR